MTDEEEDGINTVLLKRESRKASEKRVELERQREDWGQKGRRGRRERNPKSCMMEQEGLAMKASTETHSFSAECGVTG